jgi:acetyltransferase
MSIRNLKYFFEAASIAVVGASPKPHSVGATVVANLLTGTFKGDIFFINPKYSTLDGHPCYASVADLPAIPELALICTPPETIPGIVAELGAKGTKAVIVITAGLGSIKNSQGVSVKQAMLDAARPYLMRIMGPNCVGLLVPDIGLNASFAHTDALPGQIAFVSQSGALVTGVLDWAKSRGIGFSKFISLGDSADVDFGDLLDYLAGDPHTRAILMYVEDVRNARKFMSAARAAARAKPVLLVKAGRAPEGAKAAASHTGALAGADDVYDAAIRRAGMLRVLTTEDLFNAVETLASSHTRVRSADAGEEDLLILTNGGGPGVMATDALIEAGGKLAALSESTMQALNAFLPPNWSGSNPIDIIGDAQVERYVRTAEILLQQPASDAILFVHAPTAIVPSAEIAEALAPVLKQAERNVFSCWLGGSAVKDARRIFSHAGIPVFDTPEDAVKGFTEVMQYRRNQRLLMQVPSMGQLADPDKASAQEIVHAALAEGRVTLSEPEAKAILAAYGIPVSQTRIATSVAEVAELATAIGFPVAIKILSPDISHKSDVGGVVLDLETAEAATAAAQAMWQRIGKSLPAARLQGFSVQTMVRRPDATELIVGVATDPTFGPVILFGQGGTSVEVVNDHAIGLPPLNMVLARDMVSQTRIAKILAGYRNRPAARMEDIQLALVRISHLIADIPEIVELDINPLLADGQGVIALDARIRLRPVGNAAAGGNVGRARFAILPYPVELEQAVDWQGQPLLLRPIMPEDAEAHLAFFTALDAEDIRNRAFTSLHELQPSQIARMTQIDYDRSMAFIATRTGPDGKPETLGVARVVADPDNEKGEFAIIVRSDLKGQGLGTLLMNKLIGYSRQHGTREMVGETMKHNIGLLGLAEHLGFEVAPALDDETVQLRLVLNDA